MNNYRTQLMVAGVVAAMSVSALAGEPASQPVGGDPATRQVGGSQQVQQEGNRLPPPGSGSSGLRQTVQTLGALGVVVALIFATRRLLRRFGGAALTGRSTVIEVVAEARVSMRQRILLVRLGERLVLVGSGGEPITPLTEITDADEVSRLMKLVEELRSWSPAGKAASGKADGDSGEDRQ